jgi:hydroxymethylpyrimidine kinase/phosphomethylpyrimidine kinase
MTAQNPFAVSAIHVLPADFVSAQLDAVLGTFRIAALKTGMLADTGTIAAAAEKLAGHGEIAKVIDPVMIATSGARLIPPAAVDAMKRLLLPLADIVTPNLPEAETLAGMSITSADDIREAARRIHGAFGCAVLVKGGHAGGDSAEAEDTLFDGSVFSTFALPRIADPVSTHGTGCTLSAAIAANLARGSDIPDAVENAKAYVHKAISSSRYVGPDCGVLGF